MNFFVDALTALRTMPIGLAALWTIVENVAIFLLTLAVGHVLVIRFKTHPVAPKPDPISRQELLLAVSCVILNAVVTIAGIVLWRADVIRIRYDVGIAALGDFLVLFFAMDFAMYVFHRVAHHPMLYALIHQTHHRYENPRPLTLFVLNPFEVLGFGVLWLIVIALYPSSWLGIILYLTVNIAFGLVGHLGVEPLPGLWLRVPVLRYVSTSTFHSEHHQDKEHNYGFYTLIWDRLFGTLSPEYLTDFRTATADAG
jgi:Delta7-sterol 5-desaturase